MINAPFGRAFRPPAGPGLSSAKFPLATQPELWLRADTGLYQQSNGTVIAASDGDVVGYWADQSGNGRHMTQGTTSAKPVLKLDTNGINGRPVVLFDGIGNLLVTLTAATMLANAAKTIFMVFRGSGAGAYHAVISSRIDFGGVNNADKGYLATCRSVSTQYSHTGMGNAVSTITLSSGTVYVSCHSVGINGTTPTNYINGALLTLNTNTLQAAIAELPNGYTALGKQGGSFSGGSVAEVLMYAGVLSDADRSAVTSYLNSRYGAY